MSCVFCRRAAVLLLYTELFDMTSITVSGQLSQQCLCPISVTPFARLLCAMLFAADTWRAQAEDRSSSGEDVPDEAETDSALVEPLPALSGRAMRHRG